MDLWWNTGKTKAGGDGQGLEGNKDSWEDLGFPFRHNDTNHLHTTTPPHRLPRTKRFLRRHVVKYEFQSVSPPQMSPQALSFCEGWMLDDGRRNVTGFGYRHSFK